MSEPRRDQSAAMRSQGATLLAAESLRSGTSPPEAKEEKGIPLVWRIFGGTVLSIGALIAVTLYQQLHNKVETLADALVKKEEFFDHRKGIWDRIEKLRSKEQEVDGQIQERCTRLEQQVKSCEEMYKEMLPEMKLMRETFIAHLKESSVRLEQQVKSGEEERKKLLAEIQQLRERLATMERKKASPPVKITGYEKGDY
jgi:hypothetical protein